jgi:uncharacterized protein YbcC (UPF0753/DUF2309 family)
MSQTTTHADVGTTTLNDAVEAAIRLIPPAWPLAATVAVNPYLGHAGETLAETGAKLERAGGIPVTLPRDWYLAKISSCEISQLDLQAAIYAAASRPAGLTAEALAGIGRSGQAGVKPLPTISDLASSVSGMKWANQVVERMGVWAGGYLDQGQALWVAPKDESAFHAWRGYATHDLTPEIFGLKSFARFVHDSPSDARRAIETYADVLGLRPEAAEGYFHRLLTTLGGWAQAGRWLLWQAELDGRQDTTLRDLLAIRLAFEAALMTQFRSEIIEEWTTVQNEYARPAAASDDLAIDCLLQDAWDRSAQRRLVESFSSPASAPAQDRPVLQAALCIDVRSEVMRRALEVTDPSIETLGFAGFFGLPLRHRPLGSTLHEDRLPVLLKPGLRSEAVAPQNPVETETMTRIHERAWRAWGRFRQAAVSSFAFVEASGPLYAFKLLKDALRFKTGSKPNTQIVQICDALDQATRVSIAETVLRAMSLTERFGQVVLLAGHGAQVVNNPHASALHCGACGGYKGDISARVLASLLNQPAVRNDLAQRGIFVPADTLFIAGLHDTTTDHIELFAEDLSSPIPRPVLDRLHGWIERAGTIARSERRLRLPRATSELAVLRRAIDWCETRPEWGLAGCNAFIAAPRHRTAGRDLKSRTFLHSYNWKDDTSFSVLELIVTAPVVVASWISLQYYGSVVAPRAFGAGNKLLHNVIGGIGVLEGNGGTLRTGLPWQSVHDGKALVHEPHRLSVVIEAPREAIAEILAKHDGVRDLFDNGWLTLFVMEADGRLAWRYRRGLAWDALPSSGETSAALSIAA